jgi:membrane protease YdiL (CAAX protease family)
VNDASPPPLNPYGGSIAPTEIGVDPLSRPAPGARPRPRIWTVFVVILLTLVAVVVTQVAGVLALVVWHFGGSIQPDRLPEIVHLVTRPGPFIFLGLISQATMLAAALAAATLSPQPLRQRLGLVRPSLPFGRVAVTIVGVIVPFGVGIAAALGMAEVIPPDESVEKLYEQMTPAMALPFLLFISLAPGLSEELLFRGYVQRRLIERWNPWLAVLVASAIFALFHVQPHAVVFAFPVGVWLGILAWRTGSVWPGIICHAAINGLWNIYQIGTRFADLPDDPPLAALVALGIVGLAAFAWSIALLRGAPPEAELAG